jgi:hypothetical protein
MLLPAAPAEAVAAAEIEKFGGRKVLQADIAGAGLFGRQKPDRLVAMADRNRGIGKNGCGVRCELLDEPGGLPGEVDEELEGNVRMD